MRTGTIYMIIHKESKKCYIGQTIEKDPMKRIKRHFNSKIYGALTNAINRYGKDAFDIIYLHKNVPEKDLDRIEKECIWLWDSRVSGHGGDGYNQSEGGEGHTGCYLSDKEIENLSKIQIEKAKRGEHNMQDPVNQKKISDAQKRLAKNNKHVMQNPEIRMKNMRSGSKTRRKKEELAGQIFLTEEDL